MVITRAILPAVRHAIRDVVAIHAVPPAPVPIATPTARAATRAIPPVEASAAAPASTIAIPRRATPIVAAMLGHAIRDAPAADRVPMHARMHLATPRVVAIRVRMIAPALRATPPAAVVPAIATAPQHRAILPAAAIRVHGTVLVHRAILNAAGVIRVIRTAPARHVIPAAATAPAIPAALGRTAIRSATRMRLVIRHAIRMPIAMSYAIRMPDAILRVRVSIRATKPARIMIPTHATMTTKTKTTTTRAMFQLPVATLHLLHGTKVRCVGSVPAQVSVCAHLRLETGSGALQAAPVWKCMTLTSMLRMNQRDQELSGLVTARAKVSDTFTFEVFNW